MTDNNTTRTSTEDCSIGLDPGAARETKRDWEREGEGERGVSEGVWNDWEVLNEIAR